MSTTPRNFFHEPSKPLQALLSPTGPLPLPRTAARPGAAPPVAARGAVVGFTVVVGRPRCRVAPQPARPGARWPARSRPVRHGPALPGRCPPRVNRRSGPRFGARSARARFLPARRVPISPRPARPAARPRPSRRASGASDRPRGVLTPVSARDPAPGVVPGRGSALGRPPISPESASISARSASRRAPGGSRPPLRPARRCPRRSPGPPTRARIPPDRRRHGPLSTRSTDPVGPFGASSRPRPAHRAGRDARFAQGPPAHPPHPRSVPAPPRPGGCVARDTRAYTRSEKIGGEIWGRRWDPLGAGQPPPRWHPAPALTPRSQGRSRPHGPAQRRSLPSALFGLRRSDQGALGPRGVRVGGVVTEPDQ